jgi:uncharacterized protein (TIGR02284 family)
MAVRTIDDMSTETVNKLQDLVRINIDSAKGFEEAAEKLDNLTVAESFRRLAEERRLQANELGNYVRRNDEEPPTEGSYLAAFHRCWMSFRQSLGGDDSTVLSEAEAGEDQIKEAYEDALKETAGSPVNDVLTRQYADVKAAHDHVRDLRDAAQND